MAVTIAALAAVRVGAQNAPALPGPYETFGGTRWTIADFDGDGRPDVLTARPDLAGNRFHHNIEIQLSSGRRGVVTFAVEGLQSELAGIQVIARDVDGDRDVDLVFSTAVSHHPIGVWINDGGGRFAPSSDPAVMSLLQSVRATTEVSVPDPAQTLVFLPRAPSPSPSPATTISGAPEPATSSPFPGRGVDNRGLLFAASLHSRAPPALL